MFKAELKRLQSVGENALTQAEREKQSLAQCLNAAQLEAQQALRKSISDHQEEVERLVSEKVWRFFSPLFQPFDAGVFLISSLLCLSGSHATEPADGARGRSEETQAGDGGLSPQGAEREGGAAGPTESLPARQRSESAAGRD